MSAAVPNPVLRPIMRLEIAHLLDAEHHARQARRLIRPDGPADADAALDATIRIDIAISKLVAARAELNPTETASQGEPT